MFYCCLFITNIWLSEQRGNLIELTLNWWIWKIPIADNIGNYIQHGEDGILWKIANIIEDYIHNGWIWKIKKNSKFWRIQTQWLNMENSKVENIENYIHDGWILNIPKAANIEDSLYNWWIWKLWKEHLLKTTSIYYFSFQPVLHDWCNKGHGMCYPVCGMVHIK